MNGRKAILNEVINGHEITVFETQLIIRNINQKPSQSWFTIIKMNIDGKQSNYKGAMIRLISDIEVDAQWKPEGCGIISLKFWENLILNTDLYSL